MLALCLTDKERIVLKNRATGKIIAKIVSNGKHEHSPTIARLAFDAKKDEVVIYREPRK